MTKRSTFTHEAKIDKNQRALRKQHWPQFAKELSWVRQDATGFTTIPRGLTHVMQIMDSLSKGKPLSSTYFTLWCWVRDAHVLDIRNPLELARESGFGGQRAESSWRDRMRILRDLGFIHAKDGLYGEFSYILIPNPFHVIKTLDDDGRIQKDRMNALVDRLRDVGATDLEG